jgi:hypothetical protein
MRVIDVRKSLGEFVSTNHHEYRRNGPDSWEIQMGDSWESVFRAEELEAAYQEYIQKTTQGHTTLDIAVCNCVQCRGYRGDL